MKERCFQVSNTFWHILIYSPQQLVNITKPISPKQYEYIRQLVYEKSRINLGANKKELVMARLSKRLRALGLHSYKDYIDLIDSSEGKDELTNLIDSISTNHTFFFREETHFMFLSSVVLPQFCPPGTEKLQRNFRIWSAASSTGEEPYSIAITLDQYFSNTPGWNWNIQCTDISTRVLQKAYEGIFPKERLEKIRPETLRKYFQKGRDEYEGYYRVIAELRRRMRFDIVNLLQPSYPFNDTFQVIFCRNVMIYFDRETQQELVEKLTRQIVPGGYLMIGHAESLTNIKHRLRMIKPAIYQKQQ